MSYLLNLSSTPGSSVTKEFDPPLDETIQVKADCGVLLSPEEEAAWVVPRLLRYPSATVKVACLRSWAGSRVHFWFARPSNKSWSRLRQGAAVSSRSRFGVERKATRSVLWNLLLGLSSRLNAVVIEETDFTKGRGSDGYKRSAGRISLLPDTRCVIDPKIVANHHLWRVPDDYGTDPDDPASVGSSAYFCSNELHDFVKTERLDGWSFDKKCVNKTT